MAVSAKQTAWRSLPGHGSNGGLDSSSGISPPFFRWKSAADWLHDSGNGSISGHVFQDEDRDKPLEKIKVLGVNTNKFDFFDTNTDQEGAYSLPDLPPGEYVILTSQILNEAYDDLFLEAYKDLILLDPNRYVEGEQLRDIRNVIKYATKIILFPGEDITDIDIGLSSYKYSFTSGLNLFGYPGVPVSVYDESHEICAELGTDMKNFRWKDTTNRQWELTSANSVIPAMPLGDNIDIVTGQGYIIYMDNQAGPFESPPFRTIPPSVYSLRPGKNFMAYPSSSLHSPIRTSSDMLERIGKEDEVVNVQRFNNLSGKWDSTLWLWGRPNGDHFPILQGDAYLVDMISNKNFVP